MSHQRYNWPNNLNQNVQKPVSKHTKSDFYFMFSGFLFIIAMAASTAAMGHNMIGLSISIFMLAGLNMLISLAAMFIAVDRG